MSVFNSLKRLRNSAKIDIDYGSYVEEAFLLGLWYRQFPDYMHGHINKAHDWDFHELDPNSEGHWGYVSRVYPRALKFDFISDTGDSWHQCYQDIRRLGWKRLKVHREGGVLKYLFEITRDGMPEGYSTLHLILNISISTCKQVQVGTQMVEVPIMETQCEDLKEINEEPDATAELQQRLNQAVDAVTAAGLVAPLTKAKAETETDDNSPSDLDIDVSGEPTGEVVPLVVIDDIDELNRRTKGDFDDGIPF